MSNVLVGGILLVHGVITAMIGFGATTNPNGPAMTLPAWFAWWPGPFGRSWLFDYLHAGSGFAIAGGLLWLAAGLALSEAGSAGSAFQASPM